MANKKDNTVNKESPADIAIDKKDKEFSDNIEDAIEWIVFKNP